MKKSNIIIIIVIVIILGGVAIASRPNKSNDTSNNTSQNQEEDEEEHDDPEDHNSGKQVDASSGPIEITMDHTRYSIGTIEAKAGEKVTIELIPKEGGHDLVIDEFNVDSGILPESDQPTKIEFTVPEDASGKTFHFYCSVGSHRAQGMEGHIVVN